MNQTYCFTIGRLDYRPRRVPIEHIAIIVYILTDRDYRRAIIVEDVASPLAQLRDLAPCSCSAVDYSVRRGELTGGIASIVAFPELVK